MALVTERLLRFPVAPGAWFRDPGRSTVRSGIGKARLQLPPIR